MKKVCLLLIGFSLFFIMACTSIDMASYQNEDLYAELETNDPKVVVLRIKNDTDLEIDILPDKISYSINGKESPLSPDWAAGAQPGTTVPILPRRNTNRSFVATAAIKSGAGQRDVGKWVPDSLDNVVFVFGYKIGDDEKQMVFPDNQERQLVGRVDVSSDTVFPFSKTVDERRQALYKLGLIQAQNSFGKDTHLVNIRYDSNRGWFKETATLTADVVK
jgi:hypothetical protein